MLYRTQAAFHKHYMQVVRQQWDVWSQSAISRFPWNKYDLKKKDYLSCF